MVKKAAIAAAAVAATLTVLAIAFSVPLLDRVFDDQVLLLVGLILMVWSYALEHTTRGALAGNGRFNAYGRLLGGEAVVRLAAAGLFAVVGITSAGPYGVALGVGAFFGVAAALWGQHGLLRPGPPAPWKELTRAVGWLLSASLLTQTLVNCGPVLVQVLAGPGESDLAGRYLACLVVARVPVFFFQAVQASLVPELASLAATGDHARVHAGLRRLVLALAALGLAATIGSAIIGPKVVELAFGPEFVLPRGDLALLAAGAAVFLVALDARAGTHRARTTGAFGPGVRRRRGGPGGRRRGARWRNRPAGRIRDARRLGGGGGCARPPVGRPPPACHRRRFAARCGHFARLPPSGNVIATRVVSL